MNKEKKIKKLLKKIIKYRSWIKTVRGYIALHKKQIDLLRQK